MSIIARFQVIPVRDGSMSTAIASALRALDQHPVSYETTATDTIIEADTVDQVFDAVRAAHQAIPEDRVITAVEIDEDRRRSQNMDERVASVERELGHPPQRRQRSRLQGATPQQQPRARGQAMPAQQTGQPAQMQPAGQPTGAQRSGQRTRGSQVPQPVQRQPVQRQPVQRQASGQPIQRQASSQPTRDRSP